MGSKQGSAAPNYGMSPGGPPRQGGYGGGQPGRKQGGRPPQYGWGGPQQPQMAQNAPQGGGSYRDAKNYWVNNLQSAAPDRNDPSTWYGGQPQQPQQPPGGGGEMPFNFIEHEMNLPGNRPQGGPRQPQAPWQGGGGGGYQPGGASPGVNADTRVQELMDQRGMSMEDATAQNTSAINQGADFDQSGAVSNQEWNQFQNPQQQQRPGRGKKQGGRPPQYGGGGQYGPPPPQPFTEGPAGMPFKSGADYIAPYGREGYFNQGGQTPYFSSGTYGQPQAPGPGFNFPEPYPSPEAGTGYGGAGRNPFLNMPGYGSAPFSGPQYGYMNQGGGNPGYFGAFG